jgi:RNA-directed DNA polymerase
VNTRDLESSLYWAECRVLKIQAKLHRWTGDDISRRFGDLFNLAAPRSVLSYPR